MLVTCGTLVAVGVNVAVGVADGCAVAVGVAVTIEPSWLVVTLAFAISHIRQQKQ